ncbi:dTDP-4-dehydrorhamnose 3,5-epimerase [Candidatus Micrarchaeota archaeon]|nr:dTDP-4-dehydrorhamnose 3,5-epimerase [Candidatus Micrarchaeota archaeon]
MTAQDLEVKDLPLEGAFIIKPKEFYDERGAFFKLYNREILKSRNVEPFFAEDYISISKKGVIRGLHYQVDPFAQAKLVRCNRGEVFDVLVDLRKSSRTFGKWTSLVLSEENKLSVYVPRGFAHGFLSMVDESVVSYKADNDYSTPHERTLIWNDRTLNINWPKTEKYLLSKKDQAGASFAQADKFE